MMQEYIKKPVKVEAMQFTDLGSARGLVDWMDGQARIIFGDDKDAPAKAIEITTLEGVMTALPGWWIIRGVEGEFYPCKPEIFAKSYRKPRFRRLKK